jgi:hypothetical protein
MYSHTFALVRNRPWPGQETPEMNSFLIADKKGATEVHETAASLPPLFLLIMLYLPHH